MKTPFQITRWSVALALGLSLCGASHAALFEDDEARRAILDLRLKVEKQNEGLQQLQRALLEQQNQCDSKCYNNTHYKRVEQPL